MSKILDQSQSTIWFQENGPGTSFEVLGIGEKAGAMTGKSIPGPGSTAIYGRTKYGTPVVIKKQTDAPGDLPGATITLYDRGTVDFLRQALQQGCPIHVQNRFARCGNLSNPTNWDVIEHYANGEINSYTPGDGPSLEFDGSPVTAEGEVTFDHVIRLVRTELSALTTTEAQNLLSIAGMPDVLCPSGDCGAGYAGNDKIMYIGAAAEAATADANVLYTRNGGSSWAATSAAPYAATATDYEDIDFIDVDFISRTQLRIIVGTTTAVTAEKARIAYADVTLGDEGTTSWTVVDVDNSSTNDTVEAMRWLLFNRLYVAVAGDIYVSTDQGESVADSAIYTGSTAISDFVMSPDEENVVALGASNLILRESNLSGTFETRTGPSGGGDFTTGAIAADGTLYAGNGTSIFKTTDYGNVAGNWTELKDFGSNKSVVAIQLLGGERALGGDSQLIRVVVDDTAGSDGGVWQSIDGGASWEQITNLSNVGYNDAYWSEVDDNHMVIVGDATGGAGVIHKLSPKA